MTKKKLASAPYTVNTVTVVIDLVEFTEEDNSYALEVYYPHLENPLRLKFSYPFHADNLKVFLENKQMEEFFQYLANHMHVTQGTLSEFFSVPSSAEQGALKPVVLAEQVAESLLKTYLDATFEDLRKSISKYDLDSSIMVPNKRIEDKYDKEEPQIPSSALVEQLKDSILKKSLNTTHDEMMLKNKKDDSHSSIPKATVSPFTFFSGLSLPESRSRLQPAAEMMSANALANNTLLKRNELEQLKEITMHAGLSIGVDKDEKIRFFPQAEKISLQCIDEENSTKLKMFLQQYHIQHTQSGKHYVISSTALEEFLENYEDPDNDNEKNFQY